MPTSLCFILLALLGGSYIEATQPPEVVTELGAIRGFQQTVHGKEIDTYFGIPFAKPPVGSRKFRRPEPIEPWTTPLDAVKQPKACPQTTFLPWSEEFTNEILDIRIHPSNLSNNCLFLNVWAPKNAEDAAVMVWLYGGGFSIGTITSNLYDGKYLSSLGDVIVVSVQYRVALYGFLYLGSEDAPGNQGLVDQHLGIKWVYDHIDKFGGDKERITIFGESAGASSTNLHPLSPLPKYFKRAILQSAPTLNVFSYSSPQKAFASYANIVQKLGCPNENSEDVMTCLINLNSTYVSEMAAFDMMQPTLDGYFLDRPPSERYTDVSGIQFMIGSNSNEGGAVAPSVVKCLMNGDPIRPTVSDEEYEKTIKAAGIVTEEDRKKLEELYETGNLDNIQKIDLILGDYLMACSSARTADNFTSGESNDVYRYFLSERSSAMPFPKWMGAVHGCDIDLVFGHAFGDFHLYTETDKVLSRMMITYWTNFAKTGNPNIGEDGQQSPYPDWPRYSVPDRAYINLKEFPSLGDGRKSKERCDFWERVGAPMTALIEELFQDVMAEAQQGREEL